MIGIAFCGPAGCGKSTLANWLVETYGFTRISFAMPVKALAQQLFNMTGKDRGLLQAIGQGMRDIDPYVWVGYLVKSIEGLEKVVVDDLRYLNEYETLKELGFVIVRLTGREKPMTAEQKAHPSEQEWRDMDPDFEIDTSKSLEKNLAELNLIITKIFVGEQEKLFYVSAGGLEKYFEKAGEKANKNYLRGRNFEYRVMGVLRQHGWHCMRRFGSKDEHIAGIGNIPIDITGFKHGTYLIVTVKFSIRGETTVFDDPKRENLVKYADRFGAIPVFAGIDEKRHVYFVDLRTNKPFEIEMFDAGYRYMSNVKIDDSDMGKLIQKAWAWIEIFEKEYNASTDEKAKVKWANAIVQLINVINRLLHRAGKTGSEDVLTKMLEDAEKLLEEAKDDNDKSE